MSCTLSANQWLRRFQVDITSNSRRVFANGRQQVCVTVTLEPREGETISEFSLSTLELLLIDDDGNIRLLEEGLTVSRERDNRFAYYADAGAPAALTASPAGTIRRHFYVSSTLPGGTLSTVYAGIWKDQECHFETNRAPFLSSVEIESITPRRFTEEHFEFSTEEALNTDYTDIDLYYLRFKDPAQRIVCNQSFGVSSDSMFYFGARDDSPWHSGLTGHGSSYRYRLYAFDMGDEFEWTSLPERVSVRINKYSDRMTLLRERHHESYSSSSTHVHSRSLWEVIDQYGNGVMLQFVPNDQGNRIGFTTEVRAPL